MNTNKIRGYLILFLILITMLTSIIGALEVVRAGRVWENIVILNERVE